jgi:hypothetical protein
LTPQITEEERYKNKVLHMTNHLEEWFLEKTARAKHGFTPCPLDRQKEIVEQFKSSLTDENLPLSVCSVCGELFPELENSPTEITSDILKPIHNDLGKPTLDKCGIDVGNQHASICKPCSQSLLKGYEDFRIPYIR